MDGYNHYIREDTNNIVIHAFSDAFETPQQGDILIESNAGRHYNPVLTDGQGNHINKWNGTQMIDRTQDADYLLFVARQNKLNEIKAAEEAALQTFQSSALSSPHTYLAGTNDMILLAAEYSYLKGDDYDGQPILWYTVEAGNVSHTKEQFIQAYLDGRSHVASTKYHRATLEYQVSQATTADEVNAITV